MSDSIDLLGKMLTVALPKERATRDPTLPKTTSVNGYPLFVAWGVWQGTDTTASGNLKGLVFLPYLQNGSSGLSKFGGQSAIESPLDMMASSEKPFNCKLSLSGCVSNIAEFHEGEFYMFLRALKPAGMVMSGRVTSYWDGHLKLATRVLKSSQIHAYLQDFYSCRQMWTKHIAPASNGFPPPPLPAEDIFNDEPSL